MIGRSAKLPGWQPVLAANSPDLRNMEITGRDVGLQDFRDCLTQTTIAQIHAVLFEAHGAKDEICNGRDDPSRPLSRTRCTDSLYWRAGSRLENENEPEEALRFAEH